MYIFYMYFFNGREFRYKQASKHLKRSVGILESDLVGKPHGLSAVGGEEVESQDDRESGQGRTAIERRQRAICSIAIGFLGGGFVALLNDRANFSVFFVFLFSLMFLVFFVFLFFF